MTSTRTNTATSYELAGEPGSMDGLSPALTTEYESPNGLLLNNPQPDAEAVPAAPGETGEVHEDEPGASGERPGDPSPVVMDAIVGSYPELADGLEVIIGTDDRIRVGNTEVYPWRAICALSITADDGSRLIGTGWLISPRTVVTAGHCVYLHDRGGWVRSIQVIPGADDASQPYGVHVASRSCLHSVSGWTRSMSRDHDYAAIVLPPSARPGDRTGYFGIATRSDAFLAGSALNLSGYPSDKAGGRQQWFMAQRPKKVSDRVITYDIDTVGGQSGSPVWVLQDGRRHGVGIHTNGSSSGNSATRINGSVYERMLSWKNLGL